MAEESQGRETNLSPGFLSSDHEPQNPYSFFGFSPADSEMGSGEIESDKDDGAGEDEYTAELTRRMAQYMLQEDDNHTDTSVGSESQSKSWGLSGSPISTLWSPLGSSHGSPEGPSKEPSPPTTPVVGGGLDISGGFFSKLEKTDKSKLLNQDSSGEPIRVPKAHRRKQRKSRQAQGSSPVIFRGGSSGTGVFLPRPMNQSQETPAKAPTTRPEKQKGTSTVLIPMRVLHALQLHYNRLDPETRQKVGGFSLYRDSIADTMAAGENTVERTDRKTAPALAGSQSDTGLPQEWTY